MKKSFVFSLSFLLMILGNAFSFAAEDILIRSDDLRLVYEDGKDFSTSQGYHLYIRKKTGIGSVMLVETTKDPAGKEDNYAYRALEYNSINGDEIRFLDGKKLDSQYGKFSLIDSTPEKDAVFGSAFHIFIPSEIAYGYPWSRNGTVKIDKGTFINIRSFEKPYGDYTGSYADNPFMFDFGKSLPKKNSETLAVPPSESEKAKKAASKNSNSKKKTTVENTEPVVEPEVFENKKEIVLRDDYNSIAVESFKNIAKYCGGKMIYSEGPATLSEDIFESMERIDGRDKADIVFAVDTTGSMKDDLEILKEKWIPEMFTRIKEFKDARIGLLLYRDYGDTYSYMGLPVKKFDFTDRVDVLEKNLNAVKIYGTEGGDIPEAVWESLYAAMNFFKWRDDASRKIILIGDAEPHPKPRGIGKYTKELVVQNSVEKNIVIDTIIVPDDKSARGR